MPRQNVGLIGLVDRPAVDVELGDRRQALLKRAGDQAFVESLKQAAIPSGHSPQLAREEQQNLFEPSMAHHFRGATCGNIQLACQEEGRVGPVSFVQRLEQRWDRREEGAEELLIHSALEISAPPDRVWEFLVAPEAYHLTTDGVRTAFRVPGTPRGAAGEQHCIVYEHAGEVRADILEVVSVDAPKCLVTRWVTGVNDVVERTTLEARGQSATSVTVQIGMRVPDGAAKKTRPAVQAGTEQSLRRIRSAVESGARLPSAQPVGEGQDVTVGGGSEARSTEDR